MASLTFSNALNSKINPRALPPPVSSMPQWKQTLNNVSSIPVVKNAVSLPSSYSKGMTPFSPQVKSTSSTITPAKPLQTDASRIIGILGKNGTNPLTPTQTQTPSPFQQAISTQQNYASGQGNPQVNTATNQLLNFGSQGSQGVSDATKGLQTIATNPNNAINSSVSGLQGIAGNQTPAVTQAEADYNKFVQESPYMLAAQHNPNVAADIASGRDSQLGRIFAEESAAKQAAVSNALSGQGQQITAGNEAGNLAATAQGQQITAGTNAGSLAQGQFNGQATAATNAASTAQNQQNAQINAAQGAGSLATPFQNGYVAIDKATGQPVGGTGMGSAIQQGGLYDAQAQGAQNYGIAQQAITGAQNQIDSITQLINNAGLNKTGVNLANATYQELQKNLSSSDYATLQNGLNAINATLSQVTGSPVDVGKLSTQKGTSLITTINNEVQLAKGKAAGYIGGQTSSPVQSNSGSSQVQFNSDGTLKAVSF